MKGSSYILVFLLLILGNVLLFLSSQLNAIFFHIGEGSILLTLIYLTFFYREIMKLLSTIGGSMELLHEQNFGDRLSLVDQYETGRMVNISNRVVEQLKNEHSRLHEQNNFFDLLIKASPMGVIITPLDRDLLELNPMALKTLGVRLENVQNKKMREIDSLLAVGSANLSKGERAAIRLSDSSTYRYIHSSFIDRGFQYSFYLVGTLIDEVTKAKKKTHERAIHMIAHGVSDTTVGITSIPDTIEQALSNKEGMEDIYDVIHVCTGRRFSAGRSITYSADVVKIPEPTLSSVNLNDSIFTCKRFMEGMCNDRRIILRMEIGENPEDMILSAILFEQVLVNIIKNATESIEAGGEIIVRILAPTTVEVIDSDQEISKETEAKLPNSFFSTKPNDRGIGPISIREVLMRHGCTLSLRAYAGGLTRFCITFP